ESGTGKELFARAVHETSDRAQGPFVIVDCSGLTETLFESELFGYEKGAFTGAHARKAGLVETAEGGTLFLDEIGDVPLALQVKLLRLLESGTSRRVGAVQMQRADVRLVAATHLPLEAMMQAGRFRKDLYFRLSAFPIHLPPLRERVEDLPVLVQTLLQQESPLNAWRIDAAAMARLARYAWPGNVRELRNVIERAKLLADGGEVREEHLPDALLAATQAGAASATGAVAAAPWASGPSDAELQRLAADRGLSRKALAQQLGLSERTLYRRLKALGVAPPAD
ncbi:MAG: sigma-54 interaction domain-containing protein, partial [Gammaproteobacteria bacterium]